MAISAFHDAFTRHRQRARKSRQAKRRKEKAAHDTSPPDHSTAAAGYSYLDDGIPSSNQWLFGTKHDDVMPDYELLEAQMNVANSAVSEEYLRHHDDAQTMYYAMAARANFKATPAVKVSISVSPGSSTPNYVFPQASTASDGNDVLTFIPVRLATGKTPGTTYTYSATHLDDGSSINLIDATFAKTISSMFASVAPSKFSASTAPRKFMKKYSYR
jgi:hypothetical protein